MELTTTRIIDAPIDRVWALQLDHDGWPAHLPNFERVTRHDPAAPFGVGSSAAITQPALGTVVWTVDHFDESADRRSYSWTGKAKGMAFTGRHEVRRLDGDRTELVLGIVMSGALAKVFAPLAKKPVQTSIEAEAAAFAAWAAETA